MTISAADTAMCNRALSDLGSGITLVDVSTDTSKAAVQCRLWYDVMRQALLQAAPWGMARKTVPLTQLALLSDSPMPDGMYPWLVKYLYPADCLRVNYILPPPLPGLPNGTPNVSGGPLFSNGFMPNRANRFIPAYDEVTVISPPSVTPRKVILSNITNAYGVYVVDVTLSAIFDASFQNALSAALAYKLVMPITGNIGMKQMFAKIAEEEITKARVKDGNEAIPSTDHTPDWISGRNVGAGIGMGLWANMGQWYNGYSDMSWGD